MTTTDAHTESLLSVDGEVGSNSRPGPVPRAAAGASRVGVAIAVAVVAAGAVATRDAILAAGWVRGAPWLPVVLHAIDALRPRLWLVPAGTLLAAAGLGLMLTALAPRRRTASALHAESAVYLRAKDIGTIARVAARNVGGVLETRAKASRRRAVVRCRITGEASRDVETSIAAAISEALSALRTPPRVVVRLRTETRS